MGLEAGAIGLTAGVAGTHDVTTTTTGSTKTAISDTKDYTIGT